MLSAWLIITLGLAVADWVAVARGWRRVRWFTKPATLLALIAWFWQQGGWQGPLVWFGLGLVFSWLGDVFLLWTDRFFLPGLVSFLLAHVLYIFGFNAEWPQWSWLALVFLALVVGAAAWVFPPILTGLKRSAHTARLRGPVIIYGAVISLMLYSALLAGFCSTCPLNAALLGTIGAGLFFLSDSILATQRFARPIRFGEVAVMVTYHLGQIALAAAALLRFVPR